MAAGNKKMQVPMLKILLISRLLTVSKKLPVNKVIVVNCRLTIIVSQAEAMTISQKS